MERQRYTIPMTRSTGPPGIFFWRHAPRDRRFNTRLSHFRAFSFFVTDTCNTLFAFLLLGINGISCRPCFDICRPYIYHYWLSTMSLSSEARSILLIRKPATYFFGLVQVEKSKRNLESKKVDSQKRKTSFFSKCRKVKKLMDIFLMHHRPCSTLFFLALGMRRGR